MLKYIWAAFTYPLEVWRRPEPTCAETFCHDLAQMKAKIQWHEDQANAIRRQYLAELNKVSAHIVKTLPNGPTTPSPLREPALQDVAGVPASGGDKPH